MVARSHKYFAATTHNLLLEIPSALGGMHGFCSMSSLVFGLGLQCLRMKEGRE